MREFLSNWLRELTKLADDDEAATSIEYAMIAGTVTLAIVFALSDIEESMRALYDAVGIGFN